MARISNHQFGKKNTLSVTTVNEEIKIESSIVEWSDGRYNITRMADLGIYLTFTEARQLAQDILNALPTFPDDYDKHALDEQALIV